MNQLTREDIQRWFRNGKAIKCGGTWYTIVRTSHVVEGFALVTSDWEVRKGKKRRLKLVTYEDILNNVNEGDWLVQIRGKKVGKLMQENAYYKIPLDDNDYPEHEKRARLAKRREIKALMSKMQNERLVESVLRSRRLQKYKRKAFKAALAAIGIAGVAALASAGDAFGTDAYEYVKSKRSRKKR